MSGTQTFRKEFIGIALPVALQGLLQASFGLIDQVMVGQLGEASIAGIGLAGRFVSLYTVVLAAVGTVAGIQFSQYTGKKDEKAVTVSFYRNLSVSVLLAAVFGALCACFPNQIMGIYTTDAAARDTAAVYLRIILIGFLVRAFLQMFGTMLRCRGHAVIPLYSGIANALINTGLNYVLIFGKFGFSPMGVKGAAIATVAAQTAELCILFLAYHLARRKGMAAVPVRGLLSLVKGRDGWLQFLVILAPILVNEFFWSLGENVYGVIYGRLGTNPCAAMTLIGPVVSLFMGLMGGVSQAAGILTGKRLGAGEYDAAYKESKKMLWYGIAGSLALSAAVALAGTWYTGLYQVGDDVKEIAFHLLIVFAILAPVKVLNMILGGGIIRSGGKTNYTMVIDLIGTWVFGVPIGLLTAFVFGLPIVRVYFLLSLEECVRLIISIAVFRRRRWMREL